MMHSCKACSKRKYCIYKPTSDVADCGYFVGSTQEQRQTNADRIREMNDEELAELFAQYSCEDSDYASLLPIEECKWGTKQEVIKRNLQWLKSEVKE